MSYLNNEATLQHYAGKVWLTRPEAHLMQSGCMQGINICVRQNGRFVPAGHLQLAEDGVYYTGGKALGGLQSPALRQHIEGVAGPANVGAAAEELFLLVAAQYQKTPRVAAVAKALQLSPGRTRRILITQGLYTSAFTQEVAWLHDGGRGKTPEEIAQLLGVSTAKVTQHLPYPHPF